MRHFNGLQSLLSTLKQAYKGNLFFSVATEQQRIMILFLFFLVRAGSADGARVCLRPHILQVSKLSSAHFTTIHLNLTAVDWE